MNSCITIKEIEFLIKKLYSKISAKCPLWGEGLEIEEGGDVCIHIADSFHCTAETNTGVKKLTSVKKIKTFTQRFPGSYDFTGNFFRYC